MDVPDQPPQRTLVIHNTPAKTPAKGVPADSVSEQEVVAVAAGVAATLRSIGYTEVCEYGVTGDLRGFLDTLEEQRPDTVFNLCEGIDGDEHHEPLVAQILEFAGIPFTGCPSRSLADSNDKHRTKQILRAERVPCPESHLISRLGELERFPLEFPVIVKPVNENASLGISIDSVVKTPEDLPRVVAHILETYRQPALVERFIDGREFNVSVIGNADPHVLPISEIDYSWVTGDVPRILFYEAKWLEDSPYYVKTPVVCPAKNLGDGLRRRIEEISRRAYVALGCRGYARVDLRVSRAGRPYVLEVNANPSLAREAGLARSARAAGLEYPALVDRILKYSLGRSETPIPPPKQEVLCEEGIL